MSWRTSPKEENIRNKKDFCKIKKIAVIKSNQL